MVLAFGFTFSLFTTFLVYLDYHYGSTEFSSEQFNTAGRHIKSGLTASVIVSQWTWAATLLQSSNVAYQYGISGPFWYAAGATIQVRMVMGRKTRTCIPIADGTNYTTTSEASHQTWPLGSVSNSNQDYWKWDT